MKLYKLVLVSMAFTSASVGAGSFTSTVPSAGFGYVTGSSSHSHQHYRYSGLSDSYEIMVKNKVYEVNGKRYAVHKSQGELEVLSIKGNLVETPLGGGHSFYLKAFKDIKDLPQ